MAYIVHTRDLVSLVLVRKEVEKILFLCIKMLMCLGGLKLDLNPL